MSMIIAFLLCACCGALFHETIQYWISRLLAVFRKKSPLIGDWTVTYEREGEQVTEQVQLFGEFADVAYGDLQARLQDGSTASYRVRLEHLSRLTYSVIFKPVDRSVADIGLGLLTVDVDTKTAHAKILGVSGSRLANGEDAYIRELVAAKA